MPAHPLPDRLQGLEAGGAKGSVSADALGRAVVDGDEDRRLPLAGDGRGQVGAPHLSNDIRNWTSGAMRIWTPVVMLMPPRAEPLA